MAKGELVGRVSTWQAIKAAVQMRFPGLGGGGFGSGSAWLIDNDFTRNIVRSIARFAGTSIDFQREVGDPTLSSLVMAAVNWLGRTVPEAQLQVVETDAEGKDKPIPAHPALAVLRRPNQFYSGATLWKAFACSWITGGNVYWLKARNARGQVIQLWHAPNWSNGLSAGVCPRWPVDGSEFISFYEYSVDQYRYQLPVADVVHFRNGLDSTLRQGVPLIEPLYREIYKDNAESNYGALLARNGAVPPVVLSIKEGMSEPTPEDLKEYKASYQASTQGDERGKVFVSNYPIEVSKLGFTPAEMDLRDAHRFNEERFAAVTGIPAIVLGFGAGLESSTYNNTEQADERAVENFLVPLWRYIEDELTHQLGADFGLKPNQRFAFDLSKVRALAEDQDALHKRASLDLASGGITLNEYREMIGRRPDPAGDYYLRRQGVMVVTPEIVQAQIERTLNPPEPMEPQPGREKEEPDAQKRFRLPFQYSIKAKFDYSSTQINLPDDLAALLLDLGAQIPDEDLAEGGREDEPHITVRYGLHTQKAADVEPLLTDVAPLKATFGYTTYFKGDDFDVVYVSVKSPDLHALNETLAALEHTDTHKGYTPHVTVAYVKPGKGKEYAGKSALYGVECVFDELIFSTKGGKPTAFKLTGAAKSLPSVKRQPTDLEAKQLPAVAKAQDSARAALSIVLSQIRARLIADGLESLPALADDYTDLKLELTATEQTALQSAINLAYESGRNTVPGQTIEVKGLIDVARRIFKAIAPAFVVRVTARIVDEYSRARLRGLSQAEALKQVEDVLNDEPAAYVEEIASGAAYEAVGSGRLDELKAMAQPGDRFVYSSLLDKNACSACKADDGKESDDPAKLPHTPNPLCSGRWRCRCALILIHGEG